MMPLEKIELTTIFGTAESTVAAKLATTDKDAEPTTEPFTE